MPSEATDRQQLLLSQNSSSKYAPPKVTESVPCPRCDSTNTKFCYYNNYNLSQPRHFCKSCRRYWTQGGTLRNIPVGGGTRKNSKRTRTSSSSSSGAVHAALATTPTNLSSTCSSSVTQEQRVAQPPNQVSFFPCGDPEMGLGMTTSDVNLNESSFNFPETAAGSYTSMLNMQIQGQNFHEHGAGFHDFGIGSGLDDLELGFGTTRSWEIPAGPAGYAGCTVGDSSGCNTWHLMNGGDDHQGGNGGVGEDCFVWPGLAISTPAVKGFK